jgi:hypothetical protein
VVVSMFSKTLLVNPSISSGWDFLATRPSDLVIMFSPFLFSQYTLSPLQPGSTYWRAWSVTSDRTICTVISSSHSHARWSHFETVLRPDLGNTRSHKPRTKHRHPLDPTRSAPRS